MKIVLTMDEVCKALLRKYGPLLTKTTPLSDLMVSFVHRYGDGSGEIDIEAITAIHHVEIATEEDRPK